MTHTYYTRGEVGPEGTRTLFFGGELDMHASPHLDASIEAALADGARAVEIDLTQASFIDSTTIGVLVKAHKRLSAAGVPLEIVCDEPNVLRIFEVTGLEEVLPIRPSRGGIALG